MIRRSPSLLPIPASLALALTFACSPRPAVESTPSSLPAVEIRESQLQTYDQIVGLLEADYIHTDFGGADWETANALTRRRVESGLSPDEFTNSIRALLAQLPADTTTYRTRTERIEADLAESPVYEGIGAFVALRSEPEPHIVLLSVIPGSPAEEAGLLAHEAIYAVDGTPVRAEAGDADIQRVRGPEGTRAELLVGTPAGSRRTVTVERRQVVATDPVRGGLVAAGLPYLLAPVAADSSLAEAVAAALAATADEEPRHGIILDLRIAHSTASWPLLELLALFADGELGAFTSRGGDAPLEVDGQDLHGSQSVPLTVLVGPDTSGTPEIFAAALQAAGRSTTVGLPTRGSVLGFSSQVLFDGSQLLFATTSFETPAGVDLSRIGVRPDISVPIDWDQVPRTSDPVVDAAAGILLDTP